MMKGYRVVSACLWLKHNCPSIVQFYMIAVIKAEYDRFQPDANIFQENEDHTVLLHVLRNNSTTLYHFHSASGMCPIVQYVLTFDPWQRPRHQFLCSKLV